MRLLLPFALAAGLLAQIPGPRPGGYALANGWSLTPVGKLIPTEDLILNLALSPDGRVAVAVHGGFNPHGLVVVDTRTEEAVQRIPLKSAFNGLAWSPDGKRLYAAGGNATSRRNPSAAPVYVFDYQDGRLSEKPAAELRGGMDGEKIRWSGLAHHPSKPLLYAADAGTGAEPGFVAVFDTGSGKLLRRIPVEINPYEVKISADGKRLYVSNWSSHTVTAIDTESEKVAAVVAVGQNPTGMALGAGRLFVACANDNSVYDLDAATLKPRGRIVTTMQARAPEGSTPNAVALSPDGKTLYVANADNNTVMVVDVAEAGESEIKGFIPSGWYPSALAATPAKLYIGASKGGGSYANIRGPHSKLPPGDEGKGSVKSLQKGAVEIVATSEIKTNLKKWSAQSLANSPYKDDLLVRANMPADARSVVPAAVGAGSPIKHVLYIIKENRTYDQVFSDLPKGKGDPRLLLFGRKVTPNHHALAEEFVLFDNLFCDGEVSVDGHSWSTAAYATDFNEKMWPANYGGHSKVGASYAWIPSAGFIWDQAARKGLTYRSYGEMGQRVSDGTSQTMEAQERITGLRGHFAPRFKLPGMRDTDNAREFIREFDEFEKNYDSADAKKRLPNLMVMSLGEDHTQGTTPGRPTPTAAVASNDQALGMIVERITHSKYWPETAIFVIEDDAQDGSDHVDARRTIGLVVSPYTKRGILDSTLYTTSSMLRTIELLLGLPPMSQYDAAATPMYRAFGEDKNLKPFTKLPPQVDVDAINQATAWGAKASLAMDFSEYDRTDMFELNEIVWKSVKGADSPMPLPVHRYVR